MRPIAIIGTDTATGGAIIAAFEAAGFRTNLSLIPPCSIAVAA